MVHVYNGIWLTYKREQNNAIWIELENIILSELKSEKERQIPYAITYMWTDSQTQRTDLRLPRVGKEKGWIKRELEVSRGKPLYTEERKKVLLYSIKNCIQYPMINIMGNNFKKDCIYLCITESLCCTAEINIVNQLYFKFF